MFQFEMLETFSTDGIIRSIIIILNYNRLTFIKSTENSSAKFCLEFPTCVNYMPVIFKNRIAHFIHVFVTSNERYLLKLFFTLSLNHTIYGNFLTECWNTSS